VILANQADAPDPARLRAAHRVRHQLLAEGEAEPASDFEAWAVSR
jgi:hypothetical protein